MKEVVVTGAGKVGATIARRLLAPTDYDVILADRSPTVLSQTEPHPRIHTYGIDIAYEEKLRRLVHGKFTIANAAPFPLTLPIAAAPQISTILI